MPVYWRKKLNSLIKSTKSDISFRRRKSTSSLADPGNNFQFGEIRQATSEIQFIDNDDVNADAAAGYASIGQIQQPLNEGVASTSTLGSHPNENDNISAIYSKPIKKNKNARKSISEDSISLDSDEVVEVTQLDDDYSSHHMPKDERIRNIDALQTLSLIMFDDYDRNRKLSVMRSFNTKPNHSINSEVQSKTFSIRDDGESSARRPRPTQKFRNIMVQTDNEEKDQRNDKMNIFEQIIVRLVEELKNYQPAISVDNVMKSQYPDDVISWPIDTKYLTPLFNAYDKRLREKDDIIQNYEQQLNAEVQQKNETLLTNEQNKHLAFNVDYWKRLYEDAKITIAHNESLLKQQISSQTDLERKIQELQTQSLTLEEQKKNLSSSVKHFQSQVATLREENNKLRGKLENCVPRKRYDENITEIKKVISETKRDYTDQIKDLVEKFESQTKSLTDDIHKLRAANCQLEGQNVALSKMLRLTEQKTVVYEQQNERSIEESAVTQHYMENINSVFQQIVAERDTYRKMAEEQQQETIRLMKTVLRGNLSKNKLQDKLKKYKIKVRKRNNQTTSKLERNKNILTARCQQYETKIKQLHSTLEDQQEKLQIIDREKKVIEQDLDLVWLVASMENKQFL